MHTGHMILPAFVQQAGSREGAICISQRTHSFLPPPGSGERLRMSTSLA